MKSLVRKSNTQCCSSVGEPLEWVWSEGVVRSCDTTFRTYELKNFDLVFLAILGSKTTCVCVCVCVCVSVCECMCVRVRVLKLWIVSIHCNI